VTVARYATGTDEGGRSPLIVGLLAAWQEPKIEPIAA
jgi:hypothetical protein